MRSFDERIAEIHRRSEKILQVRARRRKKLLLAIPLVLTVGLVLTLNLRPERNTAAIPDGDMTQIGEAYPGDFALENEKHTEAMGAPQLRQPPALTLCYGEGRIAGKLGTHFWNWDTGNGQWSGTKATSLHPLDPAGIGEPCVIGDRHGVLEFETRPDSVAVRCWPESDLGNYSAQGQSVTEEGYQLTLKPGRYLYEVTATWEPGGTYYGTASYVFYVDAGA